MVDITDDKVILLLGAPRSGTTWLAKIFDSHPDVLYRHEPDTVVRDWSFPGICPINEIDQHVAAARDYLHRLIDQRTLKSVGSLPMFPKSYEAPLGRPMRGAMIYALRAADRLPMLRGATRGVQIPDFLSAESPPNLRVAIKSVSSRGRTRLFAEAMPGCRIIFILRDPCGQVASMMRGTALGKFDGDVPVGEVLATEQAKRYGLTPERLAAMPAIEQLAWHWAVLNEKAIEDLQGIPTARVFRYQDLASDPVGCTRDLFGFAGLPWHAQTDAFIQASSSYAGRDRYYQVFKNTADAANRWRTELPRSDVVRITRVVRNTPLWSFCPELAEYA